MSSRSREGTQRELEQLGRALGRALDGLELLVTRADLGAERGTWYRGQLGPMASVADARSLCRLIREHAVGAGCFAVATRVTRAAAED
jgi:hypothetical protein